MAKIFISYAREDYEYAKRIYDYLLQSGQEPWLDKENILPGQNWPNAIKSAIRESQFFIALLSSNSVEKRGYVQKELRIGLEILDQIPESQIFFIPARIGECEPNYERLRELQWVDMFPDWDTGLKRLMKVFTFIPGQLFSQSLINTKWVITKTNANPNITIIFREGGALERIKYKQVLEDGKWKQSENTVYIEVNKKYAQYKGVIDKNRIIGQAQNIRGLEWDWEAAKIEDGTDNV